MLCCRITTLTFTFLTNFKISNFNKEDDLNNIETWWSVFKCFNGNILDQYFTIYRSAFVGV